MKKTNKDPSSLTQDLISTIGKQIEAERLSQDKSIKQAPVWAGVSDVTLNGLEKGYAKNISLENLVKIANGLGKKILVELRN